MQHFETEQWLPFPRDLVFAFFANPANLPPLMPRWQQPRIEEITLTPPPPRPAGARHFPAVAAGSGTTLTITARALPLLPLRGAWEALIEDFQWNESFCDLQLRGPFAYWRHCHSVRDAISPDRRTEGTLINDHVTYQLPAETITRTGYGAAQAVMTMLFRYRQARAAELLPQFAALAKLA